MSKKTVICDLDDVIQLNGFLNSLNNFLGTNYDYGHFEKTGYYLQNVIPQEMLRDFYEYLRQNSMYENCDIADESVKIIKRINQKHDFYVCSSYLIKGAEKECGWIIQQKLDFCHKVLPFLEERQLIFMADKNLIQSDVKIDDKMDNLKNATELRLLYTAHHNKFMTDKQLAQLNIKRVNNWLDISQILL